MSALLGAQTAPAERPDQASGRAEPPGEAGETRDRVVRVAEYIPFPRFSRHQRKRLGFMPDAVEPVLRVTARDPEKPGTLLRVVVRGIDGRLQRDVLARVAWCSEMSHNHHSLGLAVIDGDQPGPHWVRRTPKDNRRAISV